MGDTIRLFTTGGVPAHETAAELCDRLKDVVYGYSDRMPLATAVGVLEILKLELIGEAQ